MSILIWFLPAGVVLLTFALFIFRYRRRGRRSPITDKLLREPAHSLKREQIDKVLDGMLYLSGALLVPMLLFIIYLQGGKTEATAWVAVLIGLPVTAACIFLSLRNWSRAVRLHQGIDAEVATGQELSLLMRDGAWVFHDIPYAHGNIDHVVVSPGGVFAIETKGYSKTKNGGNDGQNQQGWKVRVKQGVMQFPNGNTRKPIEQAQRHGKWLQKELARRFQLPLAVQPVVALPGWLIEGGWDKACWVINPKGGNALRKAVCAQNLSEQEVSMIAAWIEDLSRTVEPASKRLD